MIFSRNSRIFKWVASSFLILVILTVTYSPVHKVPQAEAQEAVTVVGGSGSWADIYTGVKSAVSAAFDFISSAALQSLGLKEWTLDGVAFAVTNIIIQNLSRSIVSWINSGFQGSPSFVTDLNGFLLDVGDRTMGRFIEELGLGFMCAPFRLDVQIALDLQYRQARNFELECKLSDVVGNVENFFANDSLGEGGWQSWFALTTRPANNPYGALVIAQQEASVRLTNARGEQVQLLNFGSGFLSFSTCDDGPLDPDEVCEITTPGAVIEEQLNNNLDSGRQRLIIADEINEILGALFAQLVQQAFTGAGGLLGLTQSGYTSEGYSYLEAATAAEQSYVGYEDRSNDAIPQSIADEERWLALQERVVSLINNAQLHDQNRWGEDCSNRPLPASLVNVRKDALDEITITENTLTLLNDLQFQFETTTDPTTQAGIYDTYLQLQADGHLHNEANIIQFELEVIGNQYFGFTPTMNDYISAVDEDCEEYFENRRNDENDDDD